MQMCFHNLWQRSDWAFYTPRKTTCGGIPERRQRYCVQAGSDFRGELGGIAGLGDDHQASFSGKSLPSELRQNVLSV